MVRTIVVASLCGLASAAAYAQNPEPAERAAAIEDAAPAEEPAEELAQPAAADSPHEPAAPSHRDHVGDTPRIAITRFKTSEGVDPGLAAQVSNRVAQVLSEKHHAAVITPDEMISMLQHESEKQTLGCDDESCMAEIAGAMGAEHVISGRITQIDQGLTVSMSKIAAKTAQVITRMTEVWGGDALAIVDVAAALADRLVHPDATGSLEVVGAVVGSQVLVDDQLRAGAPAIPIDGLRVGGHRVSVISEDMEPVNKWVVVRMGEVSSLAVSQKEIEKSVLTRWWFWTAAVGGLAVAGGAIGAGVYFGTASSGNGNATGVTISENINGAFGGR